jgi:hypothetical protein
MKKYLAVLGIAAAVICGSVALADVAGDEPFLCETQILTRAVPTESSFTAAASLNLALLNGYRVRICANSGQTLSGAGTMQAYWLSNRGSEVSRNLELDKSVNVTATSCQGAACRCMTWGDFQVAVGAGGRVIHATNGVTVSGGTDVQICYFGYKRLR